MGLNGRSTGIRPVWWPSRTPRTPTGSTAPHRPPTPQSAAHPSTAALPTVTAVAIIDCAHPSSAAAAAAARPHRTVRRSGSPLSALPPSTLRIPASRPPSASRGSYNTSGAPSAYPQASRVGRHQTLVAAARSAADRRNLGGSERAHFLYHRRTLFHLASLLPTPLSPPPHHSTTHPLRVAVHRRLSTVEALVPPPHIPCATALGAL